MDALGRYRGPYAMKSPLRFAALRPFPVLALVGGLAASAGASDRIGEVLRQKLPRYDPSIRVAEEKRQAEEAAKKTAAPDRSVPVTETKPTSPGDIASGVVILAPLEVKATRQIPRVKLPRIESAAPIDSSVDTADPYLLPDERRARLQKKHLSAFDRALNKFSLGFGLLSSGDARAADAERREQFARGAGTVADAIQLAATAGEDEAEIKKLRELYLQMLTTRPK